MSVPAGTIIDLTARGVTTSTFGFSLFTPAELQGDVLTELSKAFPRFADAVVTAESDYKIGGLLPYSYRATVRVQTAYDHQEAGEVLPYVRAAFTKAAGSAPTVAIARVGGVASGGVQPGSSSTENPNPLDREEPPFDLGAFLSGLLPDVSFTTAITVVAVAGVAILVLWKAP